MPTKDKNESLEFLKVGEAVSRGLHESLQEEDDAIVQAIAEYAKKVKKEAENDAT